MENMNIMDDFVDNQSAYEKLEENVHFDWEDNYFKKFDWLTDSNSIPDEQPVELDIYSIPLEERMKIFIKCCGVLERKMNELLTEYEPTDDLESAPLYLYYVALENDKLMLHADFKKDNADIITYCEQLYEYVKVNKPIKIIYITEIQDLYDVDKDVKIYMNMFGIENTRGGSYVDIDIPEYLLKAIEHEQKITDMKYYIHRNR